MVECEACVCSVVSVVVCGVWSGVVEWSGVRWTRSHVPLPALSLAPLRPAVGHLAVVNLGRLWISHRSQM